MPKYLIEASYETEGVKGVASKGGTARRDAVGALIGSMGGKMESFYFAFGDADVYVISELPIGSPSIASVTRWAGVVRTAALSRLWPTNDANTAAPAHAR